MMVEEADTEVKEVKEPEAKPETKPLTHVDEDSSLGALDKHKKQLEDRMDALHGADSKEREELRADLSEIKEWIGEQRKAQEDKDKIKESTSTIVLPPNDVQPQQPAGPKHEEGDKPKSFFKRAW